MLSQKEIERRDELIKDGIKDCKKLIGKQKSKEMYFFYEGSIDGFEECEKLCTLEEYANRIQELSTEESRETAYSSLRKDDEETQLLREELQIYDSNKETDLEKVWRLKGIATQINFVYERLKAYQLVYNLIKKEATKQGLNLESKF